MAKFEPGNKKGKGRPKGTPNKVTKTVKETLLQVFNDAQNDPKTSLEALLKKDIRAFYAMCAKLIPTEIQGKVDQNYTIEYKVLDKKTGEQLKSLE
jgi:hypothetical protein